MSVLFVIALLAAFGLGFIFGMILGMGIIVRRIRDYRNKVGSAFPYDEYAARAIIVDLLTYLGQ